jgi:hypothetical protein
MSTRKQINFSSAVLAISAFILCHSAFAVAESINYKFNAQLVKTDVVSNDEVDGHAVYLIVENIVFENGENATINDVATSAHIQGTGPFMQTVSLNFVDGSTITTKRQGTIITSSEGTGPLCNWTSEILKGSGRFEGIKGGQIDRATALKIQKGELEGEMQGEGTIIYTLSPK